MVEGDPLLLNQYGVIAVSRKRNPEVNSELGAKLVEYLTREDTQERIGRFGVGKFGEPLFHPNGSR
jgi:tungstate transport system substrate-binding protein